jgi:hypothetical protein
MTIFAGRVDRSPTPGSGHGRRPDAESSVQPVSRKSEPSMHPGRPEHGRRTAPRQANTERWPLVLAQTFTPLAGIARRRRCEGTDDVQAAGASLIVWWPVTSLSLLVR